jgi:hypothetical protein
VAAWSKFLVFNGFCRVSYAQKISIFLAEKKELIKKPPGRLKIKTIKRGKTKK